MAESFGVDAGRYDRARPRYPEALIRAIAAAAPGPDLLDVGIGTGIAARQFRAAGCTVVGVDADERMAAFARRQGFDVEVARFEEWEPAGRAFDAVVSGQTWHWVEPVTGAEQAAQVLRQGGRLAVFWNVLDPEREIAETFSAVYRRVLDDWDPWARPALDPYSAILTRAAEGMRATGAFDEPEQWRFDWERSYTRDEWLDQLPTGGDASQLEPGKLEELLTGMGDAIDALGGSFPLRYAAVAVTAALERRVGVDERATAIR